MEGIGTVAPPITAYRNMILMIIIAPLDRTASYATANVAL